MAKDATLLELGPANVYIGVKAKASLTVDTATVGTNDALLYRAVLGGAAGNNIKIQYDVTGGATPVVTVTGQGTVGDPYIIKITMDATTTADTVKDLVNADPISSSLVTVTRAASSDGSADVGTFAATALAGGSDTETMTELGFLGDDVVVTMAQEAGTLTGAQTGTIPLDKVIIGGSFRISLPLKEIKLENYARAFPNTLLYQDSTGTQRVDFRSKVGQSMRKLATKLEIRKIIGAGESANAKDKLVIPLASPADTEGSITYNPTEQRIINANFEAWPDSVSGRWAFMGTEVL